MTIYFSATTGGFYETDIHGDHRPDDSVIVLQKRHKELIEAQEKGAQIVASKQGKPELQWPEETTDEGRRTIFVRQVKAEAAKRIDMISPPWRQLNDMRTESDAGIDRFVQIDAIRKASDKIEVQVEQLDHDGLNDFTVVDHSLWPKTSESKAS